MNLEQAIKTAITFEAKVRDVYREARDVAKSEAGVRIFKALAEEEELHLDYLNSRLIEWRKDGKITPDVLRTAIPSKQAIQQGVARLKRRMDRQDFGTELEMLRKAYDVETETSEYYRTVVNQVGDPGKAMFQRFLEIEEGHLAIVKAEMDCVAGLGYWFDFQEFNMEE